ncbi:MAG: hypothetical protein JRI55_36900, partial [Deltaproteobacteria bacterium]|nr:hypothetical protein [Deltaproteobacteria bacterium]
GLGGDGGAGAGGQLAACDDTPPDTSFAATSIGQSDFPFTVPSASTAFRLTEDISVASGAAIQCSSLDDVIIDLAGYELTFGSADYGQWLVASGCDGLEILNGTITQGAWAGHSANIELSQINDSIGVDLHHLTFNAHPANTGTSRCRLIDAEGLDATSTIRDSTFEIGAGDNSFGITYAFGGELYCNAITLSGVNQNAGAYPRVFENSVSGAQFHDNAIVVDAASQEVNLWVQWGGGGVRVFRNTVDFASAHGRFFILDSGAQDVEIFDNTFNISSTGGVVYVFRPRGSGNIDAHDNLFHHNTVDASSATTAVQLVSIGDSQVNSRNHVYYNVLISPDLPLSFYGNAAADTKIYCNQITHTGTSGYPFEARGSGHSNVELSHNRWSTARSDGVLMHLWDDVTAAPAFHLCVNEGFTDTSVVSGAFQEGDFAFSTGSCADGAPSCADDAGARP